MKLKLLALFFLSITILYASDHKTYLQKGDEYYREFDLENAVQNYLKAYKLAENDYETLMKLTRTYNDLAEDFYELRDRKNSEAAITNALKYAEMMAEKFPDSSMTYALLAMSYGNLALYAGGNEKVKLANKIKENAEKSIKMNPSHYLPYIILGIYHRQIASLSWLERAFANTFFGSVPPGSLEESEKMMLEALKIQPEIIIAMLHLARTYREMDDTSNEIKWLKKVVEAPVQDFRDKYAKRKAQRRLDELN